MIIFATILQIILMDMRFNWDGIGVVTSVLCGIHCVVLPLFFATVPIFGVNIVHNTFFEIGMVVVALGIGIYALRHGILRHKIGFWPIILFILGIAALFSRSLLGDHELWITMTGVFFIISAHILNYLLCKKKASTCCKSH